MPDVYKRHILHWKSNYVKISKSKRRISVSMFVDRLTAWLKLPINSERRYNMVGMVTSPKNRGAGNLDFCAGNYIKAGTRDLEAVVHRARINVFCSYMFST